MEEGALSRGSERRLVRRTASIVTAVFTALTVLLAVPNLPQSTYPRAAALTDTTPPSVPQGLTGVAEPKRYVQLSWQPSTDDSGGTIHYRVFRDGAAIGTKITATSYRDRPATVGTYQYSVRAMDAAGNKSDRSAAISVTAVTSIPDVTPPTVPQGLTGTPQEERYLRLTWQPSTDNVAGTIYYRVFRNDVAIGTKQKATEFRDQPSKQGTYRYKVRAIDASGNKSRFSYTIWRTVTNGPVDATPPSVPEELQVEALSQGQVRLEWQASTDDRVGQVWYYVERDGMRIATVTKTSFEDWRGGRTPASYTYKIQAADGAGNRSDSSAGVEGSVQPELFPWAGVLRKNGSRLEPTVALTFDDCYRSSNVEKIAGILRAQGAAGTFFPTGEAVDRAPQLWSQIGRDFPVANHTYTHPNLTKIAPEAIESQLVRTTNSIESATGRPMIPLMRPPGGYSDTTVRAVTKTLGLAVATWDIDTRDWENSPSAEVVRDRALTAKNGSVILLHDGANVVQALPEIISGLRAKGYQLVSLDELLGIPWQPEHR